MRYHLLYGALIEPYLAMNPEKRTYYHDWGNRAYVWGQPIRREIADLMGVRWIYARGVEFEDPSLVERYRSGDTRVYENISAFPRDSVVQSTRAYERESQLMTALAEADADLLRLTALVLAADGPAKSDGVAGGGASAARIVS